MMGMVQGLRLERGLAGNLQRAASSCRDHTGSTDKSGCTGIQLHIKYMFTAEAYPCILERKSPKDLSRE